MGGAARCYTASPEETLSGPLRPVIAEQGALTRGLVAIGCVEDAPPPLGGLSPELARLAGQVVESRGWTGKTERQLTVSASDGAVTVVLYGLGPSRELEHPRVKRWLDRVAGDCAAAEAPELLVVPPVHRVLGTPAGAATLLRQVALLGYAFDEYRKPSRPALRRVRVLPPVRGEGVYRGARKTAAAVARGITLARDLANTPGNRATPAWIAGRARALARRIGARAQVHGPRELARLRMAALLAVGRGSANTPRLVRLEIGTHGPAVALVGKGVTFDSGGISLKPGPAMDEMKYDKAGACAVLGAVQAVAELGLPVRLRAYLPLAENMPGGRAFRPGDVVTTRSGKTVEVLNTDAEGRLILADALTLAVEEGPEALVELSTLTGATVVALGHHGAALYSPDDGLARTLLRAAEDGGERLWRMPLWPEFREEIEGRHADLRNLGGKWGGANTAAAFLAEFMEGCESWAHLDVAGTAWHPGEPGPLFGATGFGVATIVNWLLATLDAG